MMKPLWRARRWLGIGAAGLLAGCATLGPAPSVAVSVTSILPRESTLLETSAEVALRLTNESAQPLALAGSSHKVYVNDTLVGRGVSSERVVVPAFGTAAIKVAVHADNLVLLRKAKEFSELPKLAYRLESRLHPAEGAGDLKTVATGEIDLAAFGVTLNAAPR
jgi:hypothetical protein